MTSRIGLRVCLEPRHPAWELGPLPPAWGHVVLLTWSVVPPPVDAGVPRVVAGVLAQALCAHSQVGYATVLPRHRNPSWTWTHDPAALAAAFDDSGCAWWHRAQVMLLVPPDMAVPALDAAVWGRLTADDWAASAAKLASTSAVRAVLRPGVDGDVAGLLSFDPAFERDFIDALTTNARAAGCDFDLVAEGALMAR